jgi:iron complex transport system substrate-binding protein
MRRGLLAVLLLLSLMFSGRQELSLAAQASAQEASGEVVEVKDFRGKALSFLKPAERIVCLIESALSGIYMLGAEARVVGISANVYQEESFPFYAAMDERIRTKSLPTPGNWDFINIEKVVGLKPDLVIIWAHQEEAIRALEERGIPVFGVFIQTFQDVYKEMLALGELTGSREKALQLVAQTEEALSRLANTTASIPTADRVRVYYMWAQGELETSGGPSTVNELITLAGAVNVCGSIEQEHLVVNMEKIIKGNPQVIVMWHNARKDPADILQNPMWQSLIAVRQQRVFEFPDVFSCDLWTLKYQYAVMMVAKWCYPELFRDLDLSKERMGLFRKLYGERQFFLDLIASREDQEQLLNTKAAKE